MLFIIETEPLLSSSKFVENFFENGYFMKYHLKHIVSVSSHVLNKTTTKFQFAQKQGIFKNFHPQIFIIVTIAMRMKRAMANAWVLAPKLRKSPIVRNTPATARKCGNLFFGQKPAGTSELRLTFEQKSHIISIDISSMCGHKESQRKEQILAT